VTLTNEVPAQTTQIPTRRQARLRWPVRSASAFVWRLAVTTIPSVAVAGAVVMGNIF
jgi:hypothetical protein